LYNTERRHSAIERGDLSHRVPSYRSDELGRLASRFNQMAEELERQRGLLLAAHTGLERQVTERTGQHTGCVFSPR
jgi:nitrate/nitrite-specific signal transduction histidine kinase